MLTHPGNHIGDSWYYVDGDRVHCYYLTCSDSVERHTQWDIGHASSTDLKNWELHDLALSRGQDNEWDGGCIATGSIVRFEGQFCMAYTGRWNEPGVAVGVAFSRDLFHWQKYEKNPITRIDERFYEPVGSGARHFPHWRDPFLFSDDGAVYHYVCASKNTGSADQRGTLGVACTRNMQDWQVLPPIEVDPVAQELECPQVRFVDGRWYLVFSSFDELFSQAIRTRAQGALRQSTYAMIGDSKFGPFSMRSYEPVIPENSSVQPYACQLVYFRNQWLLLGTVWNDKQDFICDPIPIKVTNDGLRADVASGALNG